MRFKKGEIPEGAKPFSKDDPRINREGRPPKLPELDAICADVLSRKEDGKTFAEQILLSYYKQAKKGNVAAGEALLNRAYGKVLEKLEHTMKKGFELIFTDDDIDE